MRARRMRTIVQQSEGSANLIKLRKHVHPDYSFHIVIDRAGAVDFAFYVGGISLLLVDCNQRRIVRLDQCFHLAVEYAVSNSTAALETGFAFPAIAVLHRRWHRMGVRAQHGDVVSGGHPDGGHPRKFSIPIELDRRFDSHRVGRHGSDGG